MKSQQLFEYEFSPERLTEVFEERIAKATSTGKDGIPATAFAKNLAIELQRISAKAHTDTYKFTTYKQKLILKGHGKPPRQISIATVRDRIVLRSMTNVLMSVFEDARLLPAHYIIREISEFIRPLDDEYSFIQIDIKDFYPSILHDELKLRLDGRIQNNKLLNLIMKAVRTPTSDTKEHRANTKGIPQGLSISNILSSIYMMDFDNTARLQFTYFRYVDDILIICKSEDAEKNYLHIKGELEKLGLYCHNLEEKSKTKIALLSDGVEYLGYKLRPNNLSVRNSSYRKMIDNIMAVMTSARYSTNHRRVLTRLNLKISGCIFNDRRMGWMFFFSMSDDVSQLRRLDAFIARTWKSLGMERYGLPKKFIKTYHEIKYNLANTRYIPRFDDYTEQQKIDLIVAMSGEDIDVVRDWTSERINKAFLKLVKKEISELEKDITPVS